MTEILCNPLPFLHFYIENKRQTEPVLSIMHDCALYWFYFVHRAWILFWIRLYSTDQQCLLLDFPFKRPIGRIPACKQSNVMGHAQPLWWTPIDANRCVKWTHLTQIRGFAREANTKVVMQLVIPCVYVCVYVLCACLCVCVSVSVHVCRLRLDKRKPGNKVKGGSLHSLLDQDAHSAQSVHSDPAPRSHRYLHTHTDAHTHTHTRMHAHAHTINKWLKSLL